MSAASTKPRSVEIVVVTGMSGSGRSTAIAALEDEGYYCIDNLPTALVPGFVELGAAAESRMEKVALGLDLRDVSYVERWPAVRSLIEAAGHRLTVVFVDSSDLVLLRRFSETRRSHPLGQGRDLVEAIRTERQSLSALKNEARYVVDTSSMTVHDLKRRIRDLVSGRAERTGMAITVRSFGYKYGPASDADLLFDVRFLPNPHFEAALRQKTGLDRDVAEYVLEHQETKDLMTHLDALLGFLLPRYIREGRAYLTIGIGCTGGKHRSVVLAETIGQKLREQGYNVMVRHRDVEKADAASA
jgi:UPF0042 nucleotide-binding protein